MEREEFLKRLSLGLVFVCIGCTNNGSIPAPAPNTVAKVPPSNNPPSNNPPTNPPPPPAANQYNIDLTTKITSVNQAIKITIGSTSILVFRIAAANADASFVAIDSQCTHQGTTLQWNPNGPYLQCPNHGAEFNTAGVNILGPNGNSAGSVANLVVHKVSVSGTTLTVTV